MSWGFAGNNHIRSPGKQLFGVLESHCPSLSCPGSIKWLGALGLIAQEGLCRTVGVVRRQITIVTNLRDSIF